MFENLEYPEKVKRGTVKKYGNSAHFTLPKDWEGKEVIVVDVEDIEKIVFKKV